MRLALRELVRRPKAFALPVATLILLALFLLYPASVLDGLYDASTGALRRVDGQLVVYRSDAYRSLFRSRIDPVVRAEVAGVAGVDQVSGFGAVLVSGEVAPRSQPVGVALIGSEQVARTGDGDGDGDGTAALQPGEALADRSLQADGLTAGARLLVGPFRVPVVIVGYTDDRSLLLRGGLLVPLATWHEVLGASQPDSRLRDDASPVLVLRLVPGADAAAVAQAVDAATGGLTETVSVADAVRALPGVQQQDLTFGLIRAVTLLVATVVVALFLSFVVLERAPLYAVLKAIGASSAQLFRGVLAQVVLATGFAVIVAVAITWALGAVVPLGLPIMLHGSRVVETTVGLVATAVIGSSLSLRRVIRIDPAAAIR
jgi:putative ABC transport system permease protein